MRSVGIGFLVAATAAAAGFLVVPPLILGAPLEPVMGFVQKIFYFHVPCATMLFLVDVHLRGRQHRLPLQGVGGGRLGGSLGRRAGGAVRRSARW